MIGNQDITASESEQLAQAKVELLEAREASVRADEAKTEFIANMSHELRTPMNAVIGMAEALWETDLSDEQRKLLSVLMNGGKSLLRIINDVLDLSRMREGRLILEEDKFAIGTLVQNVIDLLKPMAESKRLKLRVEQSSALDEVVFGDPMKIEQILMNLVANAIKFTPSGEVRVQVEKLDTCAGSKFKFTVLDTGIGIPASKLSDLFNRFTQADMSLTKTYGGSGLGLAISKQLVEMMGGEISVQSEEGRGSTFSFNLHLRSAQPASIDEVLDAVHPKKHADPAHLEKTLNGLRILLVEDSQDNAFLIQTFLKNIDCELDFAINGRDAIEKFTKAEYDLILMDVQMPEMDGYSATKWIRVLETKKKRRTPIIALTAYAFTEQVAQSLEAGCDAHLSKPVDKKSLLNTIASIAAP